MSADILFQKVLDNTATEEERKELYRMMEMPGGAEAVYTQIDLLLAADKDLRDISDAEMESMLHAIYAAEVPVKKKQIPTILRIGAWAAAAAAVLLLLTLSPIWKNEKRSLPGLPEMPVLPGGNMAVLTLANGQQVILDSTGQQYIAQQQTMLLQQRGQLIYQQQGNTAASGYNTLTTPRGGQFKVVLPDGTTVWLNAASSLRYPLAFGKKERTVEVSGEAYFEVAGAANTPFIVKTAGDQTIEVLGTAFNVNAYTDEATIQTTLVSGAIAVNDGQERRQLQPGQAAVTHIDKHGIELIPHPEIAQVTAWKNGVFDFNRVPLKAVMMQLSRWYNIEVTYADHVPDITFWGRMDRNLPLADVLLILEKSEVHFKIERNGTKLVVMP